MRAKRVKLLLVTVGLAVAAALALLLARPPRLWAYGACFGAARHAYNGTVGDGGPPWYPGTPVRIYQADPDPNIPPSIPLDTSALQRRGVVIMGGNCNHTSTCLGGSDVWEYGGGINPFRWGTAMLQQHVALVTNGERVVHLIQYYPCPVQ